MNAGQMGYYRVLYNEDNWQNIIEELKRDHGTFSALVGPNGSTVGTKYQNSLSFQDRIGLISDAFTLCHANLMSCQITLNLISYLPTELNWGPITTALRHLEKWRRILKYSECFLMLTEFVKSILLKPSEIVGWNNTGKEEIR